MREVARHAFLGRGREEVAAAFDYDPLAGGGNRSTLHVLGRIHAASRQRRTVTWNRNRDHHILASPEIQQPQLATELEDDLAFTLVARPDARPLDVIVGVLGHLLLGLRRHVVRPDVHPVLGPLITQVIDDAPIAAWDPHGQRVVAFPIGEPLGAVVLHVVEPQIGGHAAAVPFPGAVVRRVERVGQPLAVRAECTEPRVGHGQLLARAAAGRDREELGLAGKAGKAVREVQELVAPLEVRARPISKRFARRVVRDASRHAAGCGNGVDVTIAFVVADERNRLAIGAEACERLLARRARQRQRSAAGFGHDPQVVGVAEDDVRGADIGVANHRAVGGHICPGGSAEHSRGEHQSEWRTIERFGAIGFHVLDLLPITGESALCRLRTSRLTFQHSPGGTHRGCLDGWCFRN